MLGSCPPPSTVATPIIWLLCEVPAHIRPLTWLFWGFLGRTCFGCRWGCTRDWGWALGWACCGSGGRNEADIPALSSSLFRWCLSLEWFSPGRGMCGTLSALGMDTFPGDEPWASLDMMIATSCLWENYGRCHTGVGVQHDCQIMSATKLDRFSKHKAASSRNMTHHHWPSTTRTRMLYTVKPRYFEVPQDMKVSSK